MNKFIKFKSILIIILIICIYINIRTTPILLRGIVEGFYGVPWNYEIRADLLRFCGEYNLNSYIYAPKDDPYHRNKWRESYPDDKIKELNNLAKIANQNKVHFIFAVSPGLDLNYEGEKGEQDLQSMINKLDSMYKIGIKYFAIFFDDLDGIQSGKKQANFLNKLQNAINQKYVDANPLITVPTYYTRDSMIDEDGNVKAYTKEFSSLLNKNIIVLYTGDGVVCDGISDKSFQAAKNIYNRDLGIWWNYPVNDYYHINGRRNIKLALGPIEKLPKVKPNSIFYNPMEQPILSKISLGTGADYALSPRTYNPTASWNRVIEKQFGDLAHAMKIFASHSQHMEFAWAKCGPPDAPEFYKIAHQTILDIKEDKIVDFTELYEKIEEMINAVTLLLEKLPSKILNESQLMLEQFNRIANADLLAMLSLENSKLDPELKNIRQEIKNYENKARISELSAVLFIDEVIKFFEQ